MAEAFKGLGKEIAETLKNLKNATEEVKQGALNGLLRGGLIIQRTAQKRVPVEYGALRQSAFTRFDPQDRSVVIVGFTAAYAIYVHENMQQKLKGKPRPSGKGVYWGPSGQPKFLESAATDERQAVIREVIKGAKPKSNKRK